MTTDRSSGIVMLHAHMGMRVDTEAVVNDFAGRSRWLVFLFNNEIINVLKNRPVISVSYANVWF